MDEEGHNLVKTLDHLREIEKITYRSFVITTAELRTPASAIAGYTDLLLNDSALTDWQKESILNIRGYAQSLLRTLDTILDMGRTEAGWLELNIQEVDLKQLIRQVITTISEYLEEDQLASKRNISSEKFVAKIRYDIPQALPIVKMDEARIERILIESLLASIRLRRSSEAEVSFLVRCDDNRLKFEIVDDGGGLPEHLVNRGPELPPSNEVVIKKHGGTMEIKNPTKGGWVINFDLPIHTQKGSG